MSYMCYILFLGNRLSTRLMPRKEMISIACPIRRGPGENSAQHAVRKGRLASKLAKEASSWSKHWFDRVVLWDYHVVRNLSGCT